jgi:hypothetical protein
MRACRRRIELLNRHCNPDRISPSRFGFRYEAEGALNDDTTAGDLLQDYKARIAALERLAGKLALENEFLKGALENARLGKGAPSSVIAGPKASRSPKA